MTVNTNAAPAAEITAEGPTAAAMTESEFRPEGAASAVWDALTANPGKSVTELANAAGVSRPTAFKALTAFAEAGRAMRTPGGRGDSGRQLPDTWTATPDTPPDEDAQAAPAGADVPDAATDGPADEEAPVNAALSIEDAVKILADEERRRAEAEAELARAEAEEAYRRQKAAEALAKARISEDTRQALADLLAAATTAYAALVTGDDAALSDGLEMVYERTAHVRKAAQGTGRVSSSASGTTGREASYGGRSAPRPLRPEVLEHLAKFPDQVFTPGEVARVLGRSSGAVANAMDTLVKNGEAELVGEHPNRYRLAPARTAESA